MIFKLNVTSEKGKTILIYNGFKFRLQKNFENGIKQWKCTVKMFSLFKNQST